MRRRNFTEFSETFEILRRLNFTAQNFGGIEFSGANFNGTTMELYRDVGFHAVSLAVLRRWSFIAIQNFDAAAEFYRDLKFYAAPFAAMEFHRGAEFCLAAKF